jgi:hypothetical protein
MEGIISSIQIREMIIILIEEEVEAEVEVEVLSEAMATMDKEINIRIIEAKRQDTNHKENYHRLS